MIKLNRNLQEASFPSSFTGEKRKEWELDLLTQARAIRQGTRQNFQFTPSRWKTAKTNLLRESFHKCAYCEVNFTTVAYGDVEHYRPKSKYWWLAYCYFNYAASCQLCNQKYKIADFPISNKQLQKPRIQKNNTNAYLERKAGTYTPDPLNEDLGLSHTIFSSLHTTERPLSIDPYIDNPSDFFAYEYNDVIREVDVVPLNNEVRPITSSCIELLGLNRKELRDLRYRELLNYRFLRQILDDQTINDIHRQAARNLITQEFIHPKAEFSGMYRFFEQTTINFPTL